MLSNHQQQSSSTFSLTSATNSNSNSNDISTIFIIGFPDDFKERELTNMFLFAPGFEGAVLKTTNISCTAIQTGNSASTEESPRKQLIGFVKFSKPSEAVYALEILNGRILDQERGIVLKAEIAKKNYYIKPLPSPAVPITSTSTGVSIPKRLPSSLSDEETFIFGGCSVCLSVFGSCPACAPSTIAAKNNNRVMSITLPGQSDPSLICAPEVNVKIEVPSPLQPSQLKLSSFHSSSASSPPPPPPIPPVLLSKSPVQVPDRIIDICALQRNLIASPTLGSMAAIVGENFPCNTLYVGNLPPIAQEDELRALFRNCLGYRRLSFRPKSSGPMCFVEFEDIACATAAMETLYGTMISCSSPAKGGIRLSFSKNPLGLRVASPVATTTVSGSANSFMEAIGAETDNPDHQQAIATIFAHYYKTNPLRTSSDFRP